MGSHKKLPVSWKRTRADRSRSFRARKAHCNFEEQNSNFFIQREYYGSRALCVARPSPFGLAPCVPAVAGRVAGDVPYIATRNVRRDRHPYPGDHPAAPFSHDARCIRNGERHAR